MYLFYYIHFIAGTLYHPFYFIIYLGGNNISYRHFFRK